MKRWLALASVAVIGWTCWPLLRPRLLPAAGPPWLVVLDGYHRLDRALALQAGAAHRRWPILLITCPQTGQPTSAQRARANGPLLVLLEHPPLGGDTAGQAAALGRWLRDQSGQQRPRRLLLLSDSHHFPRARWAAQLAVGGLGTTVQPWPVNGQASSPELWPAFRDALRLQLWRLSGSTGARMVPAFQQYKRNQCF